MPVEKQEVEDERTETKTTPEMKQKTVEDVIAQKGEADKPAEAESKEEKMEEADKPAGGRVHRREDGGG